MASFTSVNLCILSMAATMVVFAGAAHRYDVGDAEGWRLPDEKNAHMYETWASEFTFYVGDYLVFQYKNDSVVRVDKRGYYHCNETRPGSTLKDGKTEFLLDKAGFDYFTSGDAGHCKNGMRLMVEVMDHQSPGTATSPSPSPLPSTAATIPSTFYDLVALSSLLTTMAMASGSFYGF